MIRNRLAALLGEKGLKITRVAKDVGISRNTITATAQNDSEMIRLETINTLCKYLNITPAEFFAFEPLDISFFVDIESMPFNATRNKDSIKLACNEFEADLFMDVNWGHNKKNTFELSCELATEIMIQSNLSINEINEGIEVDLKVEFNDEEEKKFFFDQIYKEIDGAFYQDIFQSLVDTVTNSVKEIVMETVEHYIENNLDTDHSYIGALESITADVLTKVVDSLKLNVITDDFKPF